jgi:signal peptidase II
MKHIKIKVVAIIIIIVIIDQTLKFYVKQNFPLGGGFDILGLSWAKIEFTENKGMALGIEWGNEFGKIALSLFRIFASIGLVYFIFKSIRSNKKTSFIIALALIAGGAIGNNLDGIFYGAIFSGSDYIHVAALFPHGGGYAPVLQGEVVDMLYFPMIDTHFPAWLPVIGGKAFKFNDYIFNLADFAITVGVVMILVITIKQRKKALSDIGKPGLIQDTSA